MSKQGKPLDSIQPWPLVEAVTFVMRHPWSLQRVVESLATGLGQKAAQSVKQDGCRLHYYSRTDGPTPDVRDQRQASFKQFGIRGKSYYSLRDESA